mgnify:CR=1 FL=1
MTPVQGPYRPAGVRGDKGGMLPNCHGPARPGRPFGARPRRFEADVQGVRRRACRPVRGFERVPRTLSSALRTSAHHPDKPGDDNCGEGAPRLKGPAARTSGKGSKASTLSWPGSSGPSIRRAVGTVRGRCPGFQRRARRPVRGFQSNRRLDGSADADPRSHPRDTPGDDRGGEGPRMRSPNSPSPSSRPDHARRAGTGRGFDSSVAVPSGKVLAT